MAPLSERFERIGRLLARRIGPVTTTIIGFMMTMTGLMMSSRIALAPVGVVTSLLGVAIFLSGVFVTDSSTRA